MADVRPPMLEAGNPVPQAPMVLPPDPSRGPAGYPSFEAYMRDFNRARAESQFMRAALKDITDVESQLEKIQTMRRIISTRRLSRSIEAGMPVQEALRKNPDAWLGNATMSRMATPFLAPVPPKVPLGELVEIKDPTTGKVLHRAYRSGPNALASVPPEDVGATGSAKISAIKTELDEIKDDLDAVLPLGTRPDSLKPEDRQTFDSLMRRRTGLMLDLQQLRRAQPSPPIAAPAPIVPPPAAAPVIGPVTQTLTAPLRLRERTSGKLFNYRGKPEDVPTNRFEVVR